MRLLPAALAALTVALSASSVVPGSAVVRPSPAASVAVASAPVESAASTATTAASMTTAPKLRRVGTFSAPVFLTAPAGSKRQFIVEKAGRVRILDGTTVLARPYLDISSLVSSDGERGLLSIAFSPQYATNGLVYVNYTDRAGDTRVVEYRRATANRVNLASRRELLRIRQPYANHNGGLLLFDRSGKLLIVTGDGGSGGDPENRAQNLGSLLGKILRIDPRPTATSPYRIPPDNPFVGRTGIRPAIWAYGLRNPWRISYDNKGTFFVADVGQSRWEEINVVPAARAGGANYGWSIYEGRDRYKPGTARPEGTFIRPSYVYGTGTNGRCSVTGGYVYTGSVSALRGRYVYGDFCSGVVTRLTVDGTALSNPTNLFTVRQLSSFGVDARGEMYVLSLGGAVYRIVS